MNDAHATVAVLTGRLGFKPDHVALLLDAQATRAGMLKALDRLIQASQAGDVVWISYSGHGARHLFQDANGQALGTHEALVPADAWRGTPDLLDATLRVKLNALLDRGVTLVAAFDACHSGSVWRGEGAASVGTVREVPPRITQAPPPPTTPPPETRGALLMAASQANEPAVELLLGSERRGAFSHGLLSVLATAHPATPAGHLFERVQARMKRMRLKQTPVLRALGDRAERPLLGGAVSRRARQLALLKGAQAGEPVRVQAGPALGVLPGAELQAVGTPGLRLRITRSVTPMESEAVVVGDARAVPANARFEVARWTAADAPVTVWLPKAAAQAVDTRALGLTVVADPADALFRLEAVKGPKGEKAQWRWRSAARPLTPAVPLDRVAGQLPALLRLQRWLSLPGDHASSGNFPYRLRLLDQAGEPLAEPHVYGGQILRFDLWAGALGQGPSDRRHVYLVLLDAQGHSTLVYPDLKGVEDVAVPTARGPQIPLPDYLSVQVGPPYGEDLYLLITLRDPLPDPGILESRRAGKGEAPPHAANALLTGLHGRARPVRTIVPPGWSVQVLRVRSQATRP